MHLSLRDFIPNFARGLQAGTLHSGSACGLSEAESERVNLDLLWMDEIHFAPPEKPWNDDSLAKYQQTLVSHGVKVVQEFVHPQYLSAGHRANSALHWAPMSMYVCQQNREGDFLLVFFNTIQQGCQHAAALSRDCPHHNTANANGRPAY